MDDAEVIQVVAFRPDNPQNAAICDFDVEIDLRLAIRAIAKSLVDDLARRLPVICEFDVRVITRPRVALFCGLEPWQNIADLVGVAIEAIDPAITTKRAASAELSFEGLPLMAAWALMMKAENIDRGHQRHRNFTASKNRLRSPGVSRLAIAQPVKLPSM